jgi:cbb3-type cytochrome oxidase subunit 3
MNFMGGLIIFWLLTFILHMSIGGVISLFWRGVKRDQDITIGFK